MKNKIDIILDTFDGYLKLEEIKDEVKKQEELELLESFIQDVEEYKKYINSIKQKSSN